MNQAQDAYFAKSKTNTLNNDYEANSNVNVSWISGNGGQSAKANN